MTRIQKVRSFLPPVFDTPRQFGGMFVLWNGSIERRRGSNSLPANPGNGFRHSRGPPPPPIAKTLRVFRCRQRRKSASLLSLFRKRKCGASDEARTRYLHLGKVALYQMSYTRTWCLRPESNQRHGDFQSPALPTELQRHMRENGDAEGT